MLEHVLFGTLAQTRAWKARQPEMSQISQESKQQYLAEFERLQKFRRTKYGLNADRRAPTEDDVKAYIHDMFHEREGRGGRKGLAPTSISKIVSCLKRMMNAKYQWSEDLVLWKNAEQRVNDDLRHHKPDSASAFDIDDLTTWMEPKRQEKEFLTQVVISIGVTCGLRVGEMQCMLNEDVFVDPKDGDLVIVVRERKTHKTGSTTFRIAKELDGALSPWRYVGRYVLSSSQQQDPRPSRRLQLVWRHDQGDRCPSRPAWHMAFAFDA